jgi:4-hydroxybenzoate polyprenyltransferase
LAITIPFDIRDLKYDDLSLKTIPQIFGEQKAKMIALYCLAFFELISIFHFFVGDFSLQLLLALMLTSLLSGILIIRSSQVKNNFFFSFWVEGASIIMYLLLFIIPLAFGILAL